MQFSSAVIEKVGFYVYRLIDPRNGETFYVGKGKGNRVFQHAGGSLGKEDLEWTGEDEVSAKLKRIKDIRRQAEAGFGLEVIHVIHRHGMDEKTAFEVEAALIDAYPGLSNVQGGHSSGDRGSMHASQIQAKYDLPELGDCADLKLLLININAVESDKGWENVYDQVRTSWRLSPDRARQADFIIAVWRGITQAAYVAERWKALPTGRYEFEGHPAPTEIWKRLIGSNGKRVVHPDMKHLQNPIRYWNIPQ
ncbi:hypothetical protein FJM51_19800 [Amaricoccus solimangrovi]|uniref:GIY-YIG domain-containing protein n=2 Tax=Amaricoccus solimangrovi TaxID=2589815 RepID=A0A501WGH4_9RHOB|nr:hypothetical protein FJM51_19800 [Amaricoccus solimangrovi]